MKSKSTQIELAIRENHTKNVGELEPGTDGICISNVHIDNDIFVALSIGNTVEDRFASVVLTNNEAMHLAELLVGASKKYIN